MLALAGVSLAASVPVVASASQVENLQAQARRITAQIDANGEQIAALGEQYNGAVLRLQEIQSQQRRAAASLESAMQKATLLRSAKARLAAKMYTSGTPGVATLGGAAGSSRSVLADAAHDVYTQAKAARDNKVLDDYRNAQSSLRERQRRLASLERSARLEVDALGSTKRRIESANSEARALLAKVKGRLGVLIRQEQERKEAAMRAAARTRAAAASASASGPTPIRSGGATRGPAATLPNVPAPSAGAAAAIAFARAQIGKPYVWGATGPNSFDCSGLTMRAWEAGGVSMPHFSGAQFSSFPHVGLDQLQPGDLVFKGPGGSAHVALYVGGGMQIAATHTGDYVKLQPVDYPHLSGAVRP